MLLFAAIMLQISAMTLLIMYIAPRDDIAADQWLHHSRLAKACIGLIVIALLLLSMLVCMHSFGNEIGIVVTLIALGFCGMLVTLVANLWPDWLDVCMPISLTATLLVMLLSAPMLQWL